MAPTIVSTLTGRGDLPAASGNLYGLEDTQYATEISMLEAWKNPAMTALMKAGTERTETYDYHYFETQFFPYTDQINYSTGYNSSATGLVVDNASRFAVGKLVKHDLTGEIMLVTSVGSTFIGVVRDFGQSTESWTALAGSPADNDYLTIVGDAYMPGCPIPTIQSVKEVERLNYCQDHRTPWGVSEQVYNTRMRAGGSVYARREREANTKHLREIEESFFDGKPYRGTGTIALAGALSSNVTPSTAGGIDHFLRENADSTNKVDEDDLTEFEFLDFLDPALDKGNTTKWLFCSDSLRGAFTKWGITKEQTFETTKTLGMSIDKWIAPNGRELMIVTHDYLKRNQSTDYHRAYVIDFDNVFYVNFADGTTRQRPQLSYQNLNGQTLVVQEVQTIFTFRFTVANTHARLRWKTISY